eukprot:3554345-Amphidinium_carterae.1
MKCSVTPYCVGSRFWKVSTFLDHNSIWFKINTKKISVELTSLVLVGNDGMAGIMAATGLQAKEVSACGIELWELLHALAMGLTTPLLWELMVHHLAEPSLEFAKQTEDCKEATNQKGIIETRPHTTNAQTSQPSRPFPTFSVFF